MGRMGVPGVWPPLRCHVLQATLGPLSWVREHSRLHCGACLGSCGMSRSTLCR